MVSTNQADSRCFYFRISWILMARHWFYFFLSPPFSAGPQKPQTLTASKIKYEKNFTKNLDSWLKNRYFSALIFQECECELFSSLKNKVVMTYFMLLLLRPCTKWRGQKKIKSMSFHQYSWNFEVESTWVSLIDWHHKTSNI